MGAIDQQWPYYLRACNKYRIYILTKSEGNSYIVWAIFFNKLPSVYWLHGWFPCSLYTDQHLGPTVPDFHLLNVVDPGWLPPGCFYSLFSFLNNPNFVWISALHLPSLYLRDAWLYSSPEVGLISQRDILSLATDWFRNGHVTKFRSMKCEGEYAIFSFVRENHKCKGEIFRTLYCLDVMSWNYCFYFATCLKRKANTEGLEQKCGKDLGCMALFVELFCLWTSCYER